MKRLKINEQVQYQIELTKDNPYLEYMNVDLSQFIVKLEESEESYQKIRKIDEAETVRGIDIGSMSTIEIKAKKLWEINSQLRSQQLWAINDMIRQSYPTPNLVFGNNQDDKGLFEVEIMQNKQKSVIIENINSLKQTYPHLFLSYNIKVKMMDLDQKNLTYKLISYFKADKSNAEEFCQKLEALNINCKIKSQVKMQRFFETKKQLTEYMTKIQSENELLQKIPYIILRNDLTTTYNMSEQEFKEKLDQGNLDKNNTAYLGGINYQAVIDLTGLKKNQLELYDQLISMLKTKCENKELKAGYFCEEDYIAISGESNEKISILSLAKKVQRAGFIENNPEIKMYDLSQDDRILYKLRIGEFFNRVEAQDFCQSLNITEDECFIIQRLPNISKGHNELF